MKKVLFTLMCLTVMFVAGTGLKAQEITITLEPGWNWISYPNAEEMDVASAMGDFVPANGDRLKLRDASATYVNGRWRGSVTHFIPGLGYMYYSMRTEPVSFVFGVPAPLAVTTSNPINVTNNSANCGGSAVSNDGTAILMKGVCWATHSHPTTNDSYSENGNGPGTFTAAISGLTPNTVYHVRAYAASVKGVNYGEEVSFTTPPMVRTDSVTNVLANCATCWGTVSNNSGLNVIEQGVCWSKNNHNPTIDDSHIIDSIGMDNVFSITITNDLRPNTTYYVRAYAITEQSTYYGDVLTFTTKSGISVVSTAEVVNITANSATCGGTVTDDGGLAIAARGVCWGTSSNPTLSGSHSTDGTGTGSFSSTLTGLTPNTTYYVRAYATNSHVTVYGNQLSFTTEAGGGSGGNAPTGAINGLFSVSASQQVYFSQGNLQYQASTNTWRFADNQYDYVGSTNSNISSTYSGWIDLFGWGTSGYNHGANCYQPWSTSQNYNDYYPYGSYTFNLYDQTGQADWGYNPISNGGNTANQWRTLTQPEWNYVFNTRTTTSGIRYAKANVNNVNGVILLPDDWSTSTYSLSSTNSSGASFSSNTLTASQWSTLEQAGAVFLPAAGYRYGTSVNDVGSYGYYWSASYYFSSNAYYVFFYDILGTSNGRYRSNGFSVRLARVAEN